MTAATVLVVSLVLPALVAAAGHVSLLIAQTDAAISAPPAAKSYTFEVFIVLVLFGGALFAVCRSSRRS